MAAGRPVAASPATKPAERMLEPGLTFRVYQIEEEATRVPKLVADQTPNYDRPTSTLLLRGRRAFGNIGGNVVGSLTGYLRVPAAGRYAFELTSDDGSTLSIGGNLVVDHDGVHEAAPKAGEPVALKAGDHQIQVDYFDRGGPRVLEVRWKREGESTFSEIPAACLWTDLDMTRVTSPGFKRVDDGRRPGDGKPLWDVHPSWTLVPARPDDFQPQVGAMAMLPDGRLVVGAFRPIQRDAVSFPDISQEPEDFLWAVNNPLSGVKSEVSVTKIAGGLYKPSGMCVVGKDIYVAERRGVIKLSDADHDGFFEKGERIASGWEAWNYHQFAFCLVPRGGKLYLGLSTAMAPDTWQGMIANAAPNGLGRGTIVEVDPEARTWRVYAGGVRTPNGLVLGPGNTLFYVDNQGTWMPASQLADIQDGDFFGHYNNVNFVEQIKAFLPEGGKPSVYSDRLRKPAAVNFIQNEVSNSPTEPLMITSGPYQGQMLVGELTMGGVRRAFLEQVNGVWQGALFRFTQGLECGVNRMCWGPDGSLFVGGIGAAGNWSWRGTQSGLQRLVPNGRSTFEMKAVRATGEGFEIEFTQPVDSAWLGDVQNYALKTYTFRPTQAYGGEKVDEKALSVSRATASGDGTRVRLTVPGRKKGYVVHLRTDPRSRSGETIWSTETWYTLNQIPEDGRPETIKLGGKAVAAGPIGLGVTVPGDATRLIDGPGAPVFIRGNERYERSRNPRTQGQLQTADPYVEVSGQEWRTTTSVGAVHLHVECSGPAEIRVADGYVVPIDNSDDAFHAYDVYFTPPPPTAPAPAGAPVARSRGGVPARMTVVRDGKVLVEDQETYARDDRPRPSGPIVIGSTEGGKPARFRQLWVRSLEPAAYTEGPWKPLFDGKSLDAFTPVGGNARYRVENGEIVGTSVPNTPNTFLAYKTPLRDFELIAEVKTDARLNSGIMFRAQLEGGLENRTGRMRGYQCEIENDKARGHSGGLYDEARRGWLHLLNDQPYAREAWKWDQWNEVRIVARGQQIRTYINGIPCASAFDSADAEGYLGFQVHDVGTRAEPLEVRFRNMRVRELKRAE